MSSLTPPSPLTPVNRSPSRSSANLLVQNGISAVLDVARTGKDTFETVNIQGVDHTRIGVGHVSPGDVVLVHVPRWKKTLNQLVISTAERAHYRLPKRLAWDTKPRGSVNVVHAAVVLSVDAERNTMTVAEASGKRGVCQGVWNFDNPTAKDSHVYQEAKYMFYRLGDDAQADGSAHNLNEAVRAIADKWSASGGGYSPFGAALAAFRRNSAGIVGARKLVSLAKASEQAGPLLNARGEPEAMFCSQFVGRVLGAALVGDALEEAGIPGQTGSQARTIARDSFGVSPDALLPSWLHYHLDSSDRAHGVGVIEVTSGATHELSFKGRMKYRAKTMAMRHGFQPKAGSASNLLTPSESLPQDP